MPRILSIDGGGLRGVVPLRAIADIEQRIGIGVENKFDLIAGTSTGGLIAIGLTYSVDGINRKYSTEELLSIYEGNAARIFKTYSFPLSWIRRARTLWRRKYSSDGLRGVSQELFGDGRLSQCKRPVLIPYYDLRANRPTFFTSRDATSLGPKLLNPKLVDVVLSTSAAPTYFSSHKFRVGSFTDGNQQFIQAIDGGVFANNPILLALHEMISPETRAYYGAGRQRSRIYALSLGTGSHVFDYADRKTGAWGIIPWGRRLFDTISQASSTSSEYLVRGLGIPGENYLRIDIDIDDSRFAALDWPDARAFDYWKNQYDQQIRGNETLSLRIAQFLRRAGISSSTTEA